MIRHYDTMVEDTHEIVHSIVNPHSGTRAITRNQPSGNNIHPKASAVVYFGTNYAVLLGNAVRLCHAAA